jgi:LAS superfamily LD-carboxypeptidase LdcB/pimeloyl-ACP methyl ester carboxylesterase
MKTNIKEFLNKILKINIYIKILFILIICYFLIFFNIENIERKMTFPWEGIKISKDIQVPENMEEINVQMADGNVINGIYLGNREGKTVYYFHGNWLSLPYFYKDIEYIHSLWVNVIAYDYPGYGKSTWIPTQKNITQYSQIFFNDIQNKKNIKDEDVIIWGLSIWTAAAADFAGRNEFDKLIFVSPMASRYDMAKKMFGFPVQKLFFRKNTFTTIDTVKYFSQPSLIIHGNADKVIPVSQWELVYKNYWVENNIWNQKYFIEIDNFGHNWIVSRFWTALEWKLLEFIKSGTIKSDSNELELSKDNIDSWERLSQSYKNIFSADLESDNSITKFVNSSVPFNDKAYIPDNLVSFSSEFIADGKGYWTLSSVLIPELNMLAEEFYNKFGTKFQINSSYRSYAYQAWIKARGCPDNLCAKAGYSEHQSGLWFDIFAIETNAYWKNNARLWSYYEWLKIHAHKYWFTNTYQKGLDIDGYEIEPWHWRYLWVDLATYLSENNLTIAEFYYSQKKND